MGAEKKFDKSKLPSRHTTVGPERAPHRSYLHAMGLGDDEIARPLIGVATTWNEAAPCNISLSRQAQVVKRGVELAQGTPREFTTITVTDGIAMGHEGMKSSLVSREVIADSVELTMRGHCYDGLVGLAGCDKSLPGMMMAMVRLNVPSVFLYGGSILPGSFKGRDVTVQDLFEAVGQRCRCDERRGSAPARVYGLPFGRLLRRAVHRQHHGLCVEAIGLALPHSAGTPAPYEIRDTYAHKSGEAVMDLIGLNLRPRDIVTRKSLENAARVVAATGGSTNAGLHLPAIAHECGIDFDLHDVCDIFRDTPYIADLKPGGKYVAKDLFEIGGVPIVIKALIEGGYIHTDCITVTGKTIGENHEAVAFPEGNKIVYPVSNPITPTGGVVGLRGNLAPEGAIVKVAGMAKQQFTGPARVFECEEDCFAAVQKGDYEDGEVLVIRNEGPRMGRACARCCRPRRRSTVRAAATRWH